ncbi:Type IV inositol polyphosphate 5-phosphatase 9-like protein [Drosera capensis]
MWPELVANKIFKKKPVSNNFVFDCPSSDESLGSQDGTTVGLLAQSFHDTFKFKLFVSTWNVGGVVPPDDLNMDELLETSNNDCDIYVLGFQEIVPLKATNVLGLENTKICKKWNGLIKRALNKKTEEEDMPWSSYECIMSKQMVGVFITVWVRGNIRHHIRHPSVSCVGCGIMGCLGNKGAATVRFQLHETSFCFVCSHLASGGRPGDEKHRNSDVMEIISRTTFPSALAHDLPQSILDHDRVIFLGDLNYRISLSDQRIRNMVDLEEWSELLQNDQLRMELVDGGAFENWQEGPISFAPTYKYHPDSDVYYGRAVHGKKKDGKKRSPAWCDRIIWYGKGLKQEEYTRTESKLSDHRPVKAIFTADVRVSFLLEQIKHQLKKCCMDDVYLMP